ncbi:MAG: hypothetical protein JW904_12790 [Spirochaetales bacterium]|nr:hypothetical protein [Spirochaetales bacterium]
MREFEKPYSFLRSIGIYFIIVFRQLPVFLLSFFMFVIIPSGLLYAAFYFFPELFRDRYLVLAGVQALLVFFFFEFSGMCRESIDGKSYRIFSGFGKNIFSVLSAAVITFAFSVTIQALSEILAALMPNFEFSDMIIIIITKLFFLVLPAAVYAISRKNDLKSSFGIAVKFLRENLGKVMLLGVVILILSVFGAGVIVGVLRLQLPDIGDNTRLILIFLIGHFFTAFLHPVMAVTFVKVSQYEDIELKDPLIKE